MLFSAETAEQRDEQFLLHRRVDAGAEFLLGKTALLEKLVHQLVIGLGDVFDELAVQFLDLGLPFAGGRFFRDICRSRPSRR